MGDTNDQIKLFSMNLCNVLDFVGASEYVRRTQQHGNTVQEILLSVTQNITGSSNLDMYTYKFGSAIEGTTTPGLKSDLDTLICTDYPPVVENISETDYIECRLMITDNTTPPGYTKLQKVVQNDLGNVRDIKDEDEEQDSMGNLVVLNRYLIEGMTNDEIHGPAGTTLKSKKLPGLPDLDFVPAYRCMSWPKQAQTFLNRKRPSGFPSDKMIQSFTRYGCFVVPVGHHASKEKHLQWRLSFSLQERLIMFSLNEIQFKTYIVLKMIKNSFIKPCVPQSSLTSYHCKTCIFYTLEDLPLEKWTSQNLVECITRCLQTLLQWLENEFLPNYFIPEENMWKGDPDARKIITKIISSLLHATPTYLTEITCDSIGMFLQHAVAGTSSQLKPEVKEISEDIKAEFEKSQHELDRCIYKLHKWTIGFIIKCAKEVIIFAADKSLDRCITLHNAIIHRMEMDSDPRLLLEHTDLVRQMVSEYILPFLYTSLGSQLIIKHLHLNNNKQTDDRFQDSFEILEKGMESDLMSGKLKLAAVLFMMDKTLLAKEILDIIDENFNPQTTTTHCGCSKQSGYVCEALRNRIRNYKLSTLEILRQHVMVCVWFLRTEIELAPKDLRYEMFRSVFSQTPRRPHEDDWFDCAAVDADVFLFYMLYKVNQSLGYSKAMEIAQMSLLMVIEQDLNLNHVDTAHNLVGCLFKESGDKVTAWQCFLTSWTLRSDHNAAKWHMAIMLFEAVQSMKCKVGFPEKLDNIEMLYSRV